MGGDAGHKIWQKQELDTLLSGELKLPFGEDLGEADSDVLETREVVEPGSVEEDVSP